ncbi:MAG: TatD family hydrolase [Cytophagales bacterium]
MLIDTHAHIYGNELFPNLDRIVSDAKNTGLEKILMPNVDSQSIPNMLKCYEKHPDFCIPMLGLHPSYVDENYESELEKLENLLDSHPWVAIGEVGIDLFHDKTFFEQQKIVFKKQIEWASQKKLPLVIHSRKAFWECIKCLDEMKSLGFDSYGVFHCFNDSENEALACIKRGFMIGIGGTFTYKNNLPLRELIAKIGIENVVLETDAPYLTPEPFRGKPNQPHMVELVAKKMAETLVCSVYEVSEKTTSNAKRLFNLN